MRIAFVRTVMVAIVIAGGAGVTVVAPAGASVCGSIGGNHVNVSGCTDPFGYLDSALPSPPPPPPPLGAPPPPPPPAYVPPPPAPNVNVCANFGRRISVTGCV
ncbi:RNA-binding protein [Mycobacterium sp. C31M]